MKFEELSEVQKRRMAGASEEALAHRRRLYMAYIVGSAPDKINHLQDVLDRADRRFEELLATRGMCKSDRVEVAAPGELCGMRGEIEEVEPDGEILLRYPDGESDRMRCEDLKLVKHAPEKVRHRATRKTKP